MTLIWEGKGDGLVYMSDMSDTYEWFGQCWGEWKRAIVTLMWGERERVERVRGGGCWSVGWSATLQHCLSHTHWHVVDGQRHGLPLLRVHHPHLPSPVTPHLHLRATAGERGRALEMIACKGNGMGHSHMHGR